MFTNYHGYYRNTNDNIQPESAILLSSIAHRIKFLPFNSGLNAIEDLINKKHEKHESNIDELRAGKIDYHVCIANHLYIRYCSHL